MEPTTAFKIGFSVLGAFGSVSGSRKSAKAYRRMGDMYAQQGEEQLSYNQIAAQQTEARGQMSAMEETRLAEMTASRAVAVAAAGGHVQDIIPLLADIDGEGMYRASVAMFESETEAERLRFEGEQARKYGYMQRDYYRDLAKAEKKRGIAGAIGSLGGLIP